MLSQKGFQILNAMQIVEYSGQGNVTFSYFFGDLVSFNC
jgi:hypothetical protein